MKKIVLTGIFLIAWYFSNAATRKWDGGGNGISWNDPDNWDLNLVPLATDDVLLDNSLVPGSYSVSLPAGGILISVNSLTITPAGTTIVLTLPAGNTSNPGLAITGAGDAMVLNNGAVLRNSSGASAGSGITITNTFRINNGGHYIHNTSRANASIVSQLSSVPGTEGGEFEFDVPAGSYTPSFSGRTFGSLTLSAVANGGTATYVGSGASVLTIKGNFKINTGVNLSISMSADFIVKGNFDQASTSTFNLQGSTNNNFIKIQGHLASQGTIMESNTGLPVLELNGTSNQNISLSGTIVNSVTFKINNPAGVTLISSLVLPYQLQLITGKIKTTTSQLLVLIDNASCTTGSTISFVDGPMKKIGDDAFIFPTGAGAIFSPIGITNGTGQQATDEFIAEYKRSDPRNVNGIMVQPGQHHTSYVEYWTLNQGAGSSSKLVSLAVNLSASFCYALSHTYVSRWNNAGPFWTGELTSISFTGPSSFPYESGTISTIAPLNSFGDFTLITDLPESANPLPIKLTQFEVSRNGRATIFHWELETGCSPFAKFEVQKSFENSNFETIINVAGNATNRFYSFANQGSFKEITYYRLRMTDVDGIVSYSKINVIKTRTPELLITGFWPNPVHNYGNISLQAADPGLTDFTIFDISGRAVKIIHANIKAGNNTIPLDLHLLPSGVYQILVSLGKAKVVCEFIKQ
jgi:hypothetical protein